MILRRSKRPWATSMVSALRGGIAPREAGQAVAEFLLIPLDGGEEVIGFFVFDQESGGFPLRMQGVGGDHLARNVDLLEQVAQFRNLVGFFGDFLLCEGDSLSMHERTEQMDLGPIFAHGPFEHFAIDGHGFKVCSPQQPGTDSRIQRIDIGPLQNAPDGRLGRGDVALGLGMEAGADAFQLILGEASGPFGDGGITFCLREDGGDGHRQNGREGMLLAQFATGIGKAKEDLAQAFHLRVAQCDDLHGGLGPFGLGLRLRQPDPRLWVKRDEQEPFALAVIDIAAAGTAGKALGPADLRPVGGAVTGTRKARRFHKGLGQHDGMSIDGLPIGRESAQVQGKDAGGQIRERFPWQDQKTGVIGDEMQALAAQNPRPPNPLIPSLALISGGLPAQ